MAVTAHFFNNFIKDVGLKRVDLDNDVFKAFLVNGYTFDGTDVQKSDVSGEVPTGNGYTAGGAALANTTWDWNVDHLFTRFDADDVSWTATGGSIGPVTGAVIYNSSITTPTANRLVCYIDFGGSTSISMDSEFKLTFHTDGIFSITQDT